MTQSNTIHSGRPPGKREGQPAAFKGREIVAGIGSYPRPVSARATVADLWSTLDIAVASGNTALQRTGSPQLNSSAQARARAYVQQARQYYEATANADPIAKPLLAYYFILNTSKAFLTFLNPAITEAANLMHGIGEQKNYISTPYQFDQEHLLVRGGSGVFQELARNTGRGHVWNKGDIQIVRLLPYLIESIDLYATSLGETPRVIPIERTYIETARAETGREAWLTVEVSRLALKEAKLTPRSLLDSAAAFSTKFKLFDGANADTVTYQQRNVVTYKAMPAPLSELRQAFDKSLVMRNRTLTQKRDHVVLSPHADLISNEALTFATMLHFSNMVRYNPHRVEELRRGKYWWLFTSWVDRACENFLLAISSRVSHEDHVII